LSDPVFYKAGQDLFVVIDGGNYAKSRWGIDISKKTLDVCAIFGEKIRRKSFANTESGFKNLVAFADKLQLSGPHFCMEPTGCYSEDAAEFLRNSGFRVSVVNP
jgi:transposase